MNKRTAIRAGVAIVAAGALAVAAGADPAEVWTVAGRVLSTLLTGAG